MNVNETRSFNCLDNLGSQTDSVLSTSSATLFRTRTSKRLHSHRNRDHIGPRQNMPSNDLILSKRFRQLNLASCNRRLITYPIPTKARGTWILDGACGGFTALLLRSRARAANIDPEKKTIFDFELIYCRCHDSVGYYMSSICI